MNQLLRSLSLTAIAAILVPIPLHAVTIKLQEGVIPTKDGIPLALPAFVGTTDAFVTSTNSGNASPGRNYGAAGAVAISASTAVAPANTKGEFRSLIEFDLAVAKAALDSQFGAGAWNITGVQLALTAQTPANAIFNANAVGSIDVRWLANDSWIEGTGTPGINSTAGLTFNNLSSFTGVSDEALGSFSFNGANTGVSTASLGLTPGFLADLLGGGKSTFELLPSSGSQVSALFYARDYTGAGVTDSPPLRPSLSISASAVPEPGRMMLLVLSLALLATRRSRSRA